MVSGVTQGADEGKTKSLIYRLGDEKGTPIEVRLWYDPDSLKPVKRMFRFKFEAEEEREGFKLKFKFAPTEGTYTEIYEEVVFDADISDEKFKLPEEKK